MSDYSSTFTEGTGDTIDTTDFSTEFNAIEAAIATKADSASPTLITPTITTPTVNGSVLSTAVLNQKILAIGTWNMDTTVNVAIAHGLPDITKVRSVQATIMNDTGATYHDFMAYDPDGTTNQAIFIGTTNVELYRATNGFFDSNNWDSTLVDRGWIVIQYIA